MTCVAHIPEGLRKEEALGQFTVNPRRRNPRCWRRRMWAEIALLHFMNIQNARYLQVASEFLESPEAVGTGFWGVGTVASRNRKQDSPG